MWPLTSNNTRWLLCVIFIIVSLVNSLRVQRSLYDICRYDNSSLEAITNCTSKPPCKYCVTSLEHNAVYRVSDIVRESGYKWAPDAYRILTEPKYNKTFLYDMLVQSNFSVEEATQVNRSGNIISREWDNVDRLRTIIHQRAGQVLSKQDIEYINDPNTLLVYLRMGDRLDRIPVVALLHKIRQSNATRVVLSFVMHYGNWDASDVNITVNINGHERENFYNEMASKGKFAYTTANSVKNYKYVFNVVQAIKQSSPFVQIVLRSNPYADEDLALYTKAHLFAEYAGGGFEKLLLHLRGSSRDDTSRDDLLEADMMHHLDTVRVGPRWQLVGPKSLAGVSQYVILHAFAFMLIGINNVNPKASKPESIEISCARHIESARRENKKNKYKPFIFLVDQNQKRKAKKTFWGAAASTHSVEKYTQNYKDFVLNGTDGQVDIFANNVFEASDWMGPVIVNKFKEWVQLWRLTFVCCGDTKFTDNSWKSLLSNVDRVGDVAQSLNTSKHMCFSPSFMEAELGRMRDLEEELFGASKYLTPLDKCKASWAKFVRKKRKKKESETTDRVNAIVRKYFNCKGQMEKMMMRKSKSFPQADHPTKNSTSKKTTSSMKWIDSDLKNKKTPQESVSDYSTTLTVAAMLALALLLAVAGKAFGVATKTIAALIAVVLIVLLLTVPRTVLNIRMNSSEGRIN